MSKNLPKRSRNRKEFQREIQGGENILRKDLVETFRAQIETNTLRGGGNT